MDEKIREAIKHYGSVFPKLNFSSPKVCQCIDISQACVQYIYVSVHKDASWILPASSPLKCTSPADVYLLLKSSDFISHDLSPSSVFAGCDQTDSEPYNLELVLRKWYSVDRSRELRCFVRNDVLLGTDGFLRSTTLVDHGSLYTTQGYHNAIQIIMTI